MPFKPPRKLAAAELREYAHRQLTARALTVGELKAKLRRRAAALEDIDPIVAQLKDAGALNDSRYAGHFAEARSAAGTFGSRRVLTDLLRRKVASSVAKKAVAAAFSGQNEPEMVASWLARKYRNQDLGALLQQPHKLASAFRRLRQAGFSAGASIQVLKRYAAQAEELESLADAEPEADEEAPRAD